MSTSSRFRRCAAIVAAAASLSLLAQLPGNHAAQVQAASGCVTKKGPVGASFLDCSAGQVFNIVAPGEGVTSNVQDQEPMYSDLVDVAPNLTASEILKYYKDASFDTSLSKANVETFSSPHQGTVILRYPEYGVPHIFGVSRADTEFGAGYASAEDRLFEMDVLRHVGRAQLSSFAGPSPSNEAMDCSIASVAGYSEAELQQYVNNFAARFPQPITIAGVKTTEGKQIVADANAFVAGVNQYISDAETHHNGKSLPEEYAALQITPPGVGNNPPWKPTDIVATATLVQAIFATGGGDEVNSALLYESLVKKYGAVKGGDIWSDLREQDDPGAPVSIPTTFNYEHTPANVDPNSLAMPTAPPTDTFTVASNGSTHCTVKPLTPASAAAPATSARPPHGIAVDLTPLLQALRRRANPAASNELIVDAAHSATGHPIAVFGPQTGYYVPELLHEIDLHGPGLQARGVSFAGTEVFVELGHGVDYAWSATSGGSDIVDQRVEKLCNVNGSPPTESSTAYVYNGRCVPMYERTDTQDAKSTLAALCPPPADNPCPPATVTIQIERTVHGPVVGRTMAIDPSTGKPIPVAISYERSTWGDELASAPAFLEWNDPDIIHNALDFQRAAGKETGTFNWAYVDSKNVAYYSSGKLPIRNPHVNPNFPVWGTGQWDWQGFVPTNLSAADVHPRANTMPPTAGVVNGTLADGFYTNWNNKQAPGFAAADSNFSYGPVFRVVSLSDRIKAIITKRKATEADIINAMADAATVDLDGAQLVDQMAGVLNGVPLTSEQKDVLSMLQAWAADPFWGSGVPGAHRRDRNQTGNYEQGNAVAIMDELYPRLAHAVFDPWLDSSQYSQLAGIQPVDNAPGATGSSYDGGWVGYLQRALLQALGKATYPYSQNYCGGGNGLAACQSAVQGALQGTIEELTSVYGSSNPATWTCSRSNNSGSEGSGQQPGVKCDPALDDITYNAIGLTTVPGMPWQNRPTFQQVVQYPAAR